MQRVGRAGHLVGHTSKGRLIAKTAADLLESAALARAMLEGQVETLCVPSNCLDVLAQQVVACVAMDRWDVPALFDLVRGAYPYRDLTASAFEAVLKLVSGRYHLEAFRDLRPRISWDRVHNRLHALPGTAHLALVGGGAIPETGNFPVYLGDGGLRLGELDEEFVLERRVGETFVFGSSTWRIEQIEPQRVVVSAAAGRSAMAPFWRGEAAERTAELGEAVGSLSRELTQRLADPGCVEWLCSEYRLDRKSAEALRDHVKRQFRVAGAVPDDRTVLIETFRDPAGELGLVVLTPFGGKLHHALKLVLQARLRERLGISVACLHDNEGVLIRLPHADEPPRGLFQDLTPESAEQNVREELGDSALFGLRFRQNAGRALLMPRPDPAKRTPLWLQRLRAKDLLQGVRRFQDFPIVVETFRECLNEALDLPRLRTFLAQIQSGEIRIVERWGEIPSPFASGLIFKFSLKFLYEWDEPVRGDVARTGAGVDESLLDPLLDPSLNARWLDPDAIGRVEGRLRGVGHPPRSSDEMAEWLRRLGDLSTSEIFGPMRAFLADLQAQGRASMIMLSGTSEPERWIGSEDVPLYASAFSKKDDEATASIVCRFLRTHALIGLDELTRRYPIDPAHATELLERLEVDAGFIRLEAETLGAARWAEKGNLAEVRRLSIAMRRRETVAVTPEVFADFLLRRQRVHPETRREGSAAVAAALEQLRGFGATVDVWETYVLPSRVRDFRPAWLDDVVANGNWVWRAASDARSEPRVAIVPREFAGGWPAEEEPNALSDSAMRVRDALIRRGAQFVTDLARETNLDPSEVHEALGILLRAGRVTNDRFDPVRPGSQTMMEALNRASLAGAVRAGGSRARSTRRPQFTRPEGRWSLLADTPADPETRLLAWISALFDRYGVLSRETVAMDSWAPAWRELVPLLANAELRGEIRRGYFVEGLSGIQYALPDVAEELNRLGGTTGGSHPAVMVSTLDPASIYGIGAPLDIPLLEGGTARLSRSLANFLVLVGGRPVLIVESYGRRLTGLTSASEAELRSALALLPSLAVPPRRVLKVETYNTAATLASPAAPWLADLGFVRDHPGMAYYAGWS
jgi:ATP-dependent Lhr-like helicase